MGADSIPLWILLDHRTCGVSEEPKCDVLRTALGDELYEELVAARRQAGDSEEPPAAYGRGRRRRYPAQESLTVR